jgi:hypothetical protein
MIRPDHVHAGIQVLSKSPVLGSKLTFITVLPMSLQLSSARRHAPSSSRAPVLPHLRSAWALPPKAPGAFHMLSVSNFLAQLQSPLEPHRKLA